ncbi:endonuclease/exonuclease/phosphatase family protein [Paenibacillus spiritus]|uniref:Endonuclease/exonuclease/phosphatase family protein n=1 Tax=Paenibacillus spiritus TaxID=2496557 RepID=A0A5J5G8W7_9BACL|nr:endonuclease/exonuclease/phosphatase family protein [Paenibacillus spiritus]KAA9004186.1 endonuclease/exonuclease/phosphatase family protein [Paenibacillus spiritus]
MKLLTLNTHSWMEDNQEAKIRELARFIREEHFDVIALQEVNQSKGEMAATDLELERFVPAEPDIRIARDNFALVLLREIGLPYWWTWVPVHTGFVRYDEGIALLSRTPIGEAFSEYVSEMRDYENYRTRKIAGIRTSSAAKESWFVSGHFGWWEDGKELFSRQWDNAQACLDALAPAAVYVMGDFNNAAEVRGEGYDYVRSRGWTDLYEAAEEKDDGATVVKAIKGWEGNRSPLRIDLIWSSRTAAVRSCLVALNGVRGGVVSDHFGVMADIYQSASGLNSPAQCHTDSINRR